MRVACVFLPAFPLQVEVRRRPHLAGMPVAVVADGPGGLRPHVVACSRLAYAGGVRPGMSPSEARAHHPEVVVVSGSPAGWADELAVLSAALAADGPVEGARPAADSLRAPSLYLAPPPGQRARRFGDRLARTVEQQGYRARVGIAPHRFTAWAAARADRSARVTVVPRGHDAEFLAPLSLDLLPLPDEIRRLLGAAGVNTLGQFAALPPPSVARPAPGAIDYQELARGRGPDRLGFGSAPVGAPRRAGTVRASRPRGTARQLPLAG